jgi:hypothetical protein
VVTPIKLFRIGLVVLLKLPYQFSSLSLLVVVVVVVMVKVVVAQGDITTQHWVKQTVEVNL